MIDRAPRLLLRLRNRHFFALDFLVMCLTPSLALALRTDGWAEVVRDVESVALFTLAALVCKLLIFIALGLYTRYWRYASVEELGLIALASASALALDTLMFFGVLKPFDLLAPGFPRSMPLLDGLLTLLAVGAMRFSIRLADRWHHRQKPGMSTRPVLVVGAGDAGSMMVKEMQARPELGLDPVGFVDDDPAKQKVRIHNVPVLGNRRAIPELVREYKVAQVIIAMPSAPGKVIREIVAQCELARVSSRIVPGVPEIISGTVSVNQLREVRIDDLLRRELVKTDQAGVSAYVRGTCALVTGAGGSIGSELCRQLARHEPALLVLLGHGEFSIFNIERELRRRFPSLRLASVIADVRDADRLDGIVRQYHPTTIFHAAAHKHVPLMECNVEEAFTNNVLGTQAVLLAAGRNGVERFVLISSDKAVNSTSVMGATKRVAEMLVHETALRLHKPYVAVRFGNVLGSRGSVLPIFQEQIAAGGPITVTHPEMRRYFMTIPEAVHLVLQAAALGRGGEIFMLDMGEPVKIVDMVHDLIELSGLRLGEDIDVVYTGIRPGEKLYEELSLDSEDYGATSHNNIFISRNGKAPAGGAPDLEGHVAQIADLARRMQAGRVRAQLMRLVPEYQPAATSRVDGGSPKEDGE